MSNIATLTEKRNGLLARATELATQGLSTPARKEEYKRLLNESDQLSSDIALHNQINRSLDSNRTYQEERTVKPVQVSAAVTNLLTPEQRRANRNRAYLDYFTQGYSSSRLEQRDVTTSSDGSGAALIAEDWRAEWTDALKQFGPLASLIRMVTKDNLSPTKVPLADFTSLGMQYQSDDGSVDGQEADPVVSSILAGGGDTLVSFTKASVQLYRDAEVEGGLAGFIKDNLMSVASRSLEAALLSAVDSSSTALPSNVGLLSVVPTGASTTSDSAVTYAELLSLFGSVDAGYRNAPGAAFYASQTTHDAIAGILDSNNRPIFHFDNTDGLLRVFGKKVYVAGTASGMPSIGTASKPVVLFGDFSRALVAVQRSLQTRVLVERFADTWEVGFVSHLRVGSQAGISGAVKALVTAS